MRANSLTPHFFITCTICVQWYSTPNQRTIKAGSYATEAICWTIKDFELRGFTSHGDSHRLRVFHFRAVLGWHWRLRRKNMNTRQARIFAIASTAIAALIFLALTIDSHRQFPKLTHSENITPEVTHGKDVWHENNCINCHTLFGEGAYYAPDLTKITQHRGEAYLQAYMRDPSQFYDEKKHRRLMPKQDLSEKEISDLIAFLDWVSKVDNQGWPPRPILVTGSFVPGADSVASASQSSDKIVPAGLTPVTEADDPRAQGQHIFRTATPACNACHSTAPGADMAGPSLAGLATRAQKAIVSDDYQGKATDAEGFIRESIVAPSAHLTPGAMFSAGGTSFMPTGYDKSLTAEQLDHLVAYLASLK